MFTAFAVTLLGLFLSIFFFMLEIITAKYGCCKKSMNAYDYKIDKLEKSNSEEAKEIIDEINELLLQSHSKPEDINMLYQLRRAVGISNNGGLYRIVTGNEADFALPRTKSAAFPGLSSHPI